MDNFSLRNAQAEIQLLPDKKFVENKLNLLSTSWGFESHNHQIMIFYNIKIVNNPIEPKF